MVLSLMRIPHRPSDCHISTSGVSLYTRTKTCTWLADDERRVFSCLEKLPRPTSQTMSLDNRSRSRRKPLRTYKSPTAEDQIVVSPVVESPASASSSKSKGSKANKLSSRTADLKKDSGTRTTKITIRCRCPQSPPLPLFHPLGKLAMSLPPLDPTVYGLPVLAVPDEREERHGRRTKHGGGKIPEEEVDSVRQDMSAVAAVAARERASPRKRRAGGVNKRKRKDGDDGDASYPAKKTRIPRGQNGGEEETGHDSGSNVEMVGDEKRRSKRSRGAAVSSKRRESTDSSGTNTTGIDDPSHESKENNSQKEQEL